MRRLSILSLILLVVVTIAVPASAKPGDVTRTNVRYSIPEDLDLIDDLGELNHGCSGGLYTLVDGTFHKKVTTTYYPSEEAWNQGDPDSSMMIGAKLVYNGLWDVDSDPEARFELRDNNIRYDFTAGPGDLLVFIISWDGRFVDTETGEVVEWWSGSFVTIGDEITETFEGTC